MVYFLLFAGLMMVACLLVRGCGLVFVELEFWCLGCLYCGSIACFGVSWWLLLVVGGCCFACVAWFAAFGNLWFCGFSSLVVCDFGAFVFLLCLLGCGYVLGLELRVFGVIVCFLVARDLLAGVACLFV